MVHLVTVLGPWPTKGEWLTWHVIARNEIPVVSVLLVKPVLGPVIEENKAASRLEVLYAVELEATI